MDQIWTECLATRWWARGNLWGMPHGSDYHRALLSLKLPMWASSHVLFCLCVNTLSHCFPSFCGNSLLQSWQALPLAAAPCWSSGEVSGLSPLWARLQSLARKPKSCFKLLQAEATQDQMWRKRTLLHCLLEMEISTNIVQNNIEVPQKLKNRTTTWSSNPRGLGI